jgi:hypothetical protein
VTASEALFSSDFGEGAASDAVGWCARGL